MLRLNVFRCPKCGAPLREERSHFRCEACGITEACCEGICATAAVEIEEPNDEANGHQEETAEA